MNLQTLNSINKKIEKLYWRLQVQTSHNFSYTLQVTPSYSGRSCEQEWDQTVFEKTD